MNPTRRLVLRSAAATLCLPLMPSALPRETWATPPAPVRRLAIWFVPNGLVEEEVVPAEVGALTSLPTVMASLAPMMSRVSVVSGLYNYAGGVGGIHEWLYPSLLSDHYIADPVSGPLDGGLTVDQYIAQRLTTSTPYRSLTIGTGEPLRTVPEGNVAVYYNNLSWSALATPVTPIVDPRVLFDQLFGGDLDGATEERIALRRSVLDAVAERTAALTPHLDVEDRAKLDQFQTSVREVEQRIDLLRNIACEAPPEPTSGLPFPERVDLTADLMTLALQCDYTRVLAFGIGPSTTGTSYTHLGITKAHHQITHDYLFTEQDRAWFEQIMAWNFETWAAFLARLAAIPTPTGDLLSETLAPLVTEFGAPSDHTPWLPMILAGGEAGGVVQGRHRAMDGDYAHSNVLRAFADFMQVDPEGFGEHATETLDLTS